MALANYLADRQRYFENLLESGDDSSSMSLVERLSFYEMTIDSLILQSKAHEKRIGELEERLKSFEEES